MTFTELTFLSDRELLRYALTQQELTPLETEMADRLANLIAEIESDRCGTCGSSK